MSRRIKTHVVPPTAVRENRVFAKSRAPQYPTLTLPIALSVFTSVLYVLAFPNFNLSWLAWVALIPLVIAVKFSGPLARRHAFLCGWLAGTLASSVILYWIVVTFHAAHLSIGLAALCLALLAAYLGLFWGAWTWFLSWRSDAWTVAAAWVTLEYLRTHLFSGFPWALLADSQVKNIPIIQIAEFTGTYGIGFLIVLVNVTLTSVRSPRFKRSLALTGALLAACVLYGIQRVQNPAASPPDRIVKVALLQGNIDQYKKWDKSYVQEIQTTYEHLISEAVQSKPDLIVWPETSVPGYLLQDPPLRQWLENTVRESGTAHLLGAPVLYAEKAYNSAFSINNEGKIVGEYDKTHLVPFGEIVPWSSFLGRFVRVLNELGGFTAGTKSAVVQADSLAVAVNICYEAIFPDLVRSSVLEGGEVIANLTNDGWYMRTAAPYQHWAPNILRAVENHRWVIRADNTGISGIIDPMGRVMAASRVFEPAVVPGIVAPLSDLTFYTKYGDVFAWACVLLCAGTLVLYILRTP